jgi:nucleotide-binding universal stress UspA family protein
MGKMLIALDESKSSMKAVEYAAEQFSTTKDLQITLVHVLPNLPAIFWDEGHILSDDEKKDRKKVVDKWLADRLVKMEPLFRKATELLVAKGVGAARIGRKTISDSLDAADSILEAAKDGGFGTIVLGRHSSGNGSRHLIGIVTNKVMSHAAGLTVIVVD